MAKFDWKGITREDVIMAIEIFLADNPEYPSPRSTFLVYDGKKLPAKHIRGMAYKVAYNEEISKEDYAGGMETVRFFQRLGFEMYYTGQSESSLKISVPKKEKKKEPVKDKEDYSMMFEEEKVIEKPVKVSPVVNVANKEVSDKIIILSKNVIEQKNALQLILNKMFNGDIVCEKTYHWLKTPTKIEGEYATLYEALAAYRGNQDFAKKNVVLRCDFVCEGEKLIIEYDERQHFSEARKVSLESYPDLPVYFDRKLWIKACADIQAKDSQPVNRDEVRAYYDSTRDIEASKHGYRIVRIMHGQIDFEENDAEEKLRILLNKSQVVEEADEPRRKLKIAMYLQSDQLKIQKEFDKAIEAIKKTDADLLVLPEFCWVPCWRVLENADLAIEEDCNKVFESCLGLSREINRAIIVSSIDKYGTIYSVFANAYANETETECSLYIKHTMTGCSAFEFDNYPMLAGVLFAPIAFKGYWLGMTICYDCNHALFSRMYGVQDVNIIINSTGGNVIYDKWHKYNQSRAIENQCYTFVTMGGDGKKERPNSYVYGFSPNGKELKPHLINGSSNQINMPGGIYIYDLADDDGGEEPESSINQFKTGNKYQDFFIPVGNIDKILKKATEVEKNLYVYKHEDFNIIIVVTEYDEIFMAETFLPLMYSEKLKKYRNRRYVLVSKYEQLDSDLYKNQLSVVLKVRAMENFCAVILESDIENNCYQTGKSKTAQVLKPENGMYGLDLSRMTGPEAIWKNKGDYFKVSWRKNFEWLANKCKYVADNKSWD